MDWTLPKGEKPGLLIPHQYKNRWELRIGDSKDLLAPALQEEECEIFIHDSFHTYEHMMWEYVTSFVNMKSGKVIISDDTLWNNAWWDFTDNFSLPRFHDLANPHLGVTVIKH
jgi:hypothetical protein